MSVVDLPGVESVEPEPLGRISAALERSFRAMVWLSEADSAAMEVARHFASVLDAAAASGSAELMLKAQNYGPHLKNILNDLGGTPASRGELVPGEGESDPVDGLLNDLGDFAKKTRAKKAS